MVQGDTKHPTPISDPKALFYLANIIDYFRVVFLVFAIQQCVCLLRPTHPDHSNACK